MIGFGGNMPRHVAQSVPMETAKTINAEVSNKVHAYCIGSSFAAWTTASAAAKL
jgi:hypothetical protein